MRADFPYIETTLERTIAVRESPDPTEKEIETSERGCHETIAGFHVRSEDLRAKILGDAIERRLQEARKIRIEIREARERMSSLGITPLAVIPAEAWSRLGREAGLIDMEPDEHGMVDIDPRVFEGRTVDDIESYYAANHQELVLKAFPRSTEYEDGPSVRVELPAPPEDVCATLRKCRALNLRVMAEPAAIRLVGLADALRQHHHPGWYIFHHVFDEAWARAQGYESYEDWVEKCPIVYTILGSVAVVLAQFGDFPIERELVDRVAAEQETITEDHVPSETTVRLAHISIDVATTEQLQRAQQRMLRTAIEGPLQRATRYFFT